MSLHAGRRAAAPVPAAVFDAVLCVAGIPYLSDLGAALTEWCRVGRPHAALSAFDWVIDYGFAEPLRTASNDLREAIFDTYADLYSAARRGGNSYDILFTRCWLPGM
jgi:ubiquinone/menaquinone biosynthesis C-methylase UbiE